LSVFAGNKGQFLGGTGNYFAATFDRKNLSRLTDFDPFEKIADLGKSEVNSQYTLQAAGFVVDGRHWCNAENWRGCEDVDGRPSGFS